MSRPLFSFALLLSLVIVSPAQQSTVYKVPVPQDQDRARNITTPELIESEPADYPDDARLRQVDGLCSMSLVVGIQGIPQDIHVLHCTDPSFDESSVNAVGQYRFKPALTQDGKPIVATVAPLVLQYHVAHHGLTLSTLVSLLANPWVGDQMPSRNLIIFDRRMSKAGLYRELILPVHLHFIATQGGSSDPGSGGIYPLTISATAPRVIEFAEEGYAALAFTHEGNSPCDVMMTIDARGRPSDPRVIHCERSELEKPAVESLLKSPYKPGYVNGKPVPIRAMIHLYYDDDPSLLPPASN
jgi:Gram-negative bacterial TonB protein C-terminal